MTDNKYGALNRNVVHPITTGITTTVVGNPLCPPPNDPVPCHDCGVMIPGRWWVNGSQEKNYCRGCFDNLQISHNVLPRCPYKTPKSRKLNPPTDYADMMRQLDGFPTQRGW